METEEHKPYERETIDRTVKKASPPWVRECKACGRKTLDEHETICIDCGASTRGK